MDAFRHAVAIVVAFLLAVGAVYCLRGVARSRGLLDKPNHRSAHSTPTPRLGGAGIVIAFLCVAALCELGKQTGSWFILLATSFIALLGYIDDLKPLSAVTRLVWQTSAAAAVVWSRGEALIEWAEGCSAPWPLVCVGAVLWVVWMTNLFNFMDGIDGLVAGQAVLASVAVGISAHYLGHSDVALLVFLLGASSAGFLVFNSHPRASSWATQDRRP
jgi:Fuc2NAc and GlcNAc transferase